MSSRDNYKKQGEPHVKGDRVVHWEEIEDAKRVIKGHMTSITNIFSMGEDWGESWEGRVRRTAMEKITMVPQMRMSPKDHKSVGEDGVQKV